MRLNYYFYFRIMNMELKIRQINVFFFISAIHKLLNINFLKQNMSIALFFFRNKVS